MNLYVLFVKTGKEEAIVKYLKKRLNTDCFNPFTPMKENLFKRSGYIKKEHKPLFPSYVFIETEVPSSEFISSVYNILYPNQDIIRILRYSNNDCAIRESERQSLLKFCNTDYCIEVSSGFKVGDKIHIVEGPLVGLESIIKKINRHKRQARIDMEMFGTTISVYLPLEIVEKVED